MSTNYFVYQVYFSIEIKFVTTRNSLTNQSITHPMDFQIETDRLEGFAAVLRKF